MAINGEKKQQEKMALDNIKKLRELNESENVLALKKGVVDAKKDLDSVLKELRNKEKELTKQRQDAKALEASSALSEKVVEAVETVNANNSSKSESPTKKEVNEEKKMQNQEKQSQTTSENQAEVSQANEIKSVENKNEASSQNVRGQNGSYPRSQNSNYQNRDRSNQGQESGGFQRQGGYQNRNTQGQEGGGFQRQGGYQNREGGYQNRNTQGQEGGGFQRQGGYQNREGGYQNRNTQGQEGGYQNKNTQGQEGGGFQRQGGYQNREGGYQNRSTQGQEGGYQNKNTQGQEGGGFQRQGGFQNREGGYQNRNTQGQEGGGFQRQGGFQNREGGYQNRNTQGQEGGGFQRQGGYQNREGGGYQNRNTQGQEGGGFQRQGGFQNREGGYQNRNTQGQEGGGFQRQGGFQNREGGYQNRNTQGQEGGGFQRQGGFQNREGGYQNRNTQGGFQNKDGNNQYRSTYGQNRGTGQGGANNSRVVGGGAGKPGFKLTYEAPAIAPKEAKQFVPKKKVETKQNDDKKVLNKKALIKKGFVDAGGYDSEDRMGSKKIKLKKNKDAKQATAIKIEHAIITSEVVPLKVLSEKIGLTAAEITKRLFKEGIIKTINEAVDFDTAEYIAAGAGITLELKIDKTKEEAMLEGFDEEADDASLLLPRPPIVTVMGHVDHGKTSLLDRIRKTDVVGGEAGGITQHIGAYTIKLKSREITFIDTPGHEAFTAMRKRGADVTDVAILVVAADDGVMPQTIEAINHAKAANVAIVVAINKIDKPAANVERLKQQLAEHGVLTEEWGGEAIMVPVSAKTGDGIQSLLETVLVVADIKELKANPTRKARGTIIEAQLDKNKGPVASVIVQNGTLRVGDFVVAGTATGRIRAMTDDKDRNVKEAGPSHAVSILGLSDVPEAGDDLHSVKDEKVAKMVSEERKNKAKEKRHVSGGKVTLDDLFVKISDGQVKALNLIVKADVQGSVEAIKSSLLELSNEQVRVNIVHAATGAINESDVMLASTSNAIVIAFNVRPDSKAKALAEHDGVDVRTYSIIYEAIADVTKAMKGMLAPEFKEVILGQAEVRNTFEVSNVGTIAGSYVTSGKIVRNAKIRLLRDNVVIFEGKIDSLKRFKDDAKEVATGYECGVTIENCKDIKVGDIIEAFMMEEIKN